MNPQYEGILQLVKSALTGKGCAMPEGFSLQEAVKIACSHGIEAMVYEGAVFCEISRTDPVMEALHKRCIRRIYIAHQQDQQIRKLLQAFAAQQIDALPLKGVVLRKLYPSPEMRRMGDADILIRKEQYPKIKRILQNLGYIPSGKTDHEIVWCHPHLRLELHTKPVPERNKVLYKYYGDGWQRAKLQKPHLYAMSPEDTFVFLIAHMAKHYTAGGIGIQHFTDLWIFRQTYPHMDMSYIHRELEKLNLAVFYQAVMTTLQIWFADAPWVPVSEEMTDFVLASGCYGTHANHVAAGAVKQGGGRFRRLWSSVFPGYAEMKMRYPILDNWPVLLPFTWIFRGVNILLFHRNRVARKSRDLNTVTDKNIHALAKHFDDIGLRSNL